MGYIIGVDGGGTKTEAVSYNLKDESIAGFITGPANPALGFNDAVSNIKSAISQCMNRTQAQGQKGECLGIFMGIAGIEVGDNQRKLETAIRNEFRCSVMGIHDSQLAHAAMLKGEDGIITIAGTGSVSYGRYHGKTDKTGGWGHVLGDQGSGYWIALEAMKHMTFEQDTGRTTSNLSLSIMEHLGVSNSAGMKDFVHIAGKYEIAKVAIVVAAQANHGNPEAINILDRAGSELAMMTERLYKKLEIDSPVTIGVSGGILRNVDRVREQFKARIEEDLNLVTIITDDISPTKGACYIYRTINGIKGGII